MEHWCCLNLFSHSFIPSFIHSNYLLSATMSQGLWTAIETEQCAKHTTSAALLSRSSWYLGCLSLQQRALTPMVLVILPPAFVVSCHLLPAPRLSFWSGSPSQAFSISLDGATQCTWGYGMFPALPSSNLISTMSLGSSLIAFFN